MQGGREGKHKRRPRRGKKVRRKNPLGFQPPPLNQEWELEAMATKKLSLFCKREYPKGEGVRNTTSNK